MFVNVISHFNYNPDFNCTESVVQAQVGVVLQLHSLMPPSFYSLAGAVRWVSTQHLNPETAFNLRHREAGPFWIVGFHNCHESNPPPLPPENRESWEFNYDGILALDPAGLNQSLMGGLSFRRGTLCRTSGLSKWSSTTFIVHYFKIQL